MKMTQRRLHAACGRVRCDRLGGAIQVYRQDRSRAAYRTVGGLKSPHHHYSTEECAGQYLISGDWNDRAFLAESAVRNFAVSRFLGFIPESPRIGLTSRIRRLASASIIRNDPSRTTKRLGHELVSYCTMRVAEIMITSWWRTRSGTSLPGHAEAIWWTNQGDAYRRRT
jgi:hypothetical protein